MTFSARTRLVLLWMLIGVIAMLVCSLMYPAAHLGGEYLPIGNDAFYHARRIIDLSLNPGAF